MKVPTYKLDAYGVASALSQLDRSLSASVADKWLTDAQAQRAFEMVDGLIAIVTEALEPTGEIEFAPQFVEEVVPTKTVG